VDGRADVEILVRGYAELPRVASTIGLVRDGGTTIVVDPGMVGDRGQILEPIAALGLSPDAVTHVWVSHHHLDHIVNIALFPNAEVVDSRSVRRDDVVHGHQGEGFRISPNVQVWLTPGHTPEDATLIVDTVAGRVGFTHLWWREDRSPEVDPYASDRDALEAGRARVMAGVDLVIPGHGGPFKTGRRR
jgi:glyoxylase-like metal-dependent hydrolase (beta-lactamase superfamily II)